MRARMLAVVFCAAAALLSACDGESILLVSGTSGSGRIDLAVTDAPVDQARRVVVSFTGVVLQHARGDQIEIEFTTPQVIDLLSLSGGTTELLLDDEPIPAGDYRWIRLQVDADSNVLDSFIEFDDGRQESLVLPSGQTGLLLVNNFTVPAGGQISLIIDFDLRKAVTNPQGLPDYILRPALRLIDDVIDGSIAGIVDPTLVTNPGCNNGLNNDVGNVVYVFEGFDATLDDIDGDLGDPITSAPVALDPATGVYGFVLAFLPPANYTLAFTCQGVDDDPEADDAIDFIAQENVTVLADQVTENVQLRVF